jgi:Rrf2 family protein
MKLSQRTQYAIEILMELTAQPTPQPLTLRELSRRVEVPIKFLEQIMMMLKRRGWVQNQRGKNSGYVLTRAAQSVTLGKILRELENAILLSAQEVQDLSETKIRYSGLFHALFQASQKAFQYLDAFTIAQLCEKSKEIQDAKSRYQMYYI